MKKSLFAALFAAAMFAGQSQAAVLIQGTGLNLLYNGSTTITDATSPLGNNGLFSEADLLSSLTTDTGYGTLNTDYADVSLTLAGALTYGGTVNILSGYFDILTTSGSGLRLSITGGTVTVSSPGNVVINASGSAVGVGGNQFNTIDPYTVSFSSQSVQNLPPNAVNGEALGRVAVTSSFDVNGTGPIPEPSTYAMIGGALVALAAIRRRK